MKTLLLFIMLIALNVSGQTTAKNTSQKKEHNVDYSKWAENQELKANFFVLKQPVKSEFVFLVGSEKVEGYKLQVCKVVVSTTDVDVTTKFKNGRSAPVLQLLVSNQTLYVGGFLEDEKGKKTPILSSSLKDDEKTITFTVVGKDFSRSFTLETGQILNQNATTMVFYTDKVGVWKIHKK